MIVMQNKWQIFPNYLTEKIEILLSLQYSNSFPKIVWNRLYYFLFDAALGFLYDKNEEAVCDQL